MARGAADQAKQAAQTAGSTAATAAGNAGNLFSQLFPLYSQEATNPAGYGASDLAAMNTASGESTGGSVAGAVGQGGLTAARTRNRGGFQAAGSEAARAGMRQNSANAVRIQGENAQEKQRQKQAGLSGMSGLYGMNTDAMLKAMGIQNEDINTEIQAGKSGWFQNFMNFLQTINPSYSKGGGFAFGG